MSNRTLVYYVIPEDDDDFEHPNVFAIHKGVKQLTIRDVVSAFPLPGTYHFRFKTNFMKTFVWEDGVDMDSVVPTYKGGVSLKVSRLRPIEGNRSDNNPADEYVYVEKKTRNVSSSDRNSNSSRAEKEREPTGGQINQNNATSDDGPRRRNSTDDLLDVFSDFQDGNATSGFNSQDPLAVNASRSTSSVISGGDLDDLDFGTSPPTTPMETTNLQPVGRHSSAPTQIDTSKNSLGGRSSSSVSNKTNSPRSSLVDDLISGNGFKL